MHIVLNELSLSNTKSEVFNINLKIETFIQSYSLLMKKYSNISRSIITPIDVNHLQLTPNYHIAQWRNSNAIDKDLKMRFQGICDRQNIRDDIPEDIEVHFQDSAGLGLTIAYGNQFPLISFEFENKWNSTNLECQVYWLNNESEKCFLVNYTNCSSVDKNQIWLTQQLANEASGLQTPEQLISCLDTLYPSLIFHKNSINQLNSQIEPRHISIIANKLLSLEKYFANWDGKMFDMDAFPPRNVSMESKETLKMFKKEHTYIYNSSEIIASYHMRYTGGIPGRIYFHPDSCKKKGIVLSLSTKLPTVSEPKMKV